MVTRVTSYLGGTGQDNTKKINVHPTLQRVSIGADILGNANLVVYGNSYANVAEGAATRFANATIFNTANASVNIFSSAANARFDMGASGTAFSQILYNGVNSSNIRFVAGGGMNNAFVEINEFTFMNNAYVRGNLFVTGTTTISNVIQLNETANTQTANAYYLTKAASDISMSNGWTFVGTNVAHFAYGSKRVEYGIQNNTWVQGNVVVGGTLFIGAGGAASYGPGAIYTDSNYGMLLRGRNVGTAAGAEFTLANSVDVHRFKIDIGGNVTVGPTHGAAKFNVTGNSFVSGNVVSGDLIAARNQLLIGSLNDTNPGSSANLVMYSAGGGLMRLMRTGTAGDVSLNFASVATGDGTDVYFSPGTTNPATGMGYAWQTNRGTGYGANTTMVINRFGNVAIGGTLNPMSNLHVNGNAFVSGNTRIGTSHIDANGFHGINHFNPKNYLHIKGTWVTGFGLAQFDTSSATQYSGFTFGNNGTTKSYNYYDNTAGALFMGGAATNPIIFGYNATSEWARFDANGSLGVGSLPYNSLFYVKKGSAGSSAEPPGNYAGRIINQTDGATEHGLIVGNRWRGVDSNTFVVGGLYDAGAGFQYDLVVNGTGLVMIGGGSPLSDAGLNVQGGGVLQSWNSGLAGATRRTWGVATEQDSVGDWQLRISTAANTKPTLTAMTFDASRRMGIYTATPRANLDVNGNLHIGDGSARLDIKANSVSAQFRYYNNGPIIFYTNDIQRMYFSGTAGMVKIGTGAPVANLDVLGNVYVTGNSTFDSNVYIGGKLNLFSNVLVSTDIFEFRSPRGISFPAGTVAQRSNKAGVIRYNTDISLLEYTNDGAAWANVGSGGGSGGSSPWIETSIRNIYLNNTAANVSIGGVTSKSNLEVMGNVFIASNLAVGGALTYGGVTLSNSVTGTGSMVLSASPTLTGTLTAATANFSGQVAFNYNGDTQTLYKNGGGTTVAYVGTTGAFGGITTDALRFRSDVGEMAWGFSGAVYMKLTTSLLTLTSALNYGGVTLSSSVTGTGSMVLSASPTLTGTLTAAAGTFSGNSFVSGNSSVGSNLYVGTLTNPVKTMLDNGIIIQGSGISQIWNSGLAGSTRRTWGIATEQVNASDWHLMYSTAANTKPSANSISIFSRGTNASNVGLNNTTTPAYELDVAGNVRATFDILSNSDRNYKENFQLIPKPLDIIDQLEGISYNYKGHSNKNYGLIAQDVEKILPDIVKGDEGSKTIAYLNLIGILVEGIKDLRKEVKEWQQLK